MKLPSAHLNQVALEQCDSDERSMIGSFLRSLVRKLRVPQGQKQVIATLESLLSTLNTPDHRMPEAGPEKK